MKNIVFPKLAEDLSPELMTSALGEWYPGVEVGEVTVLDQAHCDSGSASTAARAVLELGYVHRGSVHRGNLPLGEVDRGDVDHAVVDGEHALPTRMVLKTVLVRPGSIADLYENEVRFYREIRHELDVETPRCYAGSYDAASGAFGILMEDLTLRGAHFPDAREALTLEQMRDLLGGFARMHARFWRSPRFAGDLAWMWTPMSGGFYDFLQSSLGLEFFRGLMGQCEYKVELLARFGKSLEEMWAMLWKAQAELASEPVTLLHGDTHFGNTYLLPDGRVGLLDWQLTNRGRWAHDVTYMMMTALDIETRRAHDRELLEYYLDRLREQGVVDTPGNEEAWQLYRRTAIWGFMLGWFICPVENYGEEILRANLDRLATTLEDLDTFAALGG